MEYIPLLAFNSLASPHQEYLPLFSSSWWIHFQSRIFFFEQLYKLCVNPRLKDSSFIEVRSFSFRCQTKPNLVENHATISKDIVMLLQCADLLTWMDQWECFTSHSLPRKESKCGSSDTGLLSYSDRSSSSACCRLSFTTALGSHLLTTRYYNKNPKRRTITRSLCGNVSRREVATLPVAKCLNHTCKYIFLQGKIIFYNHRFYDWLI